MALNYTGMGNVGALPVWSFADEMGEPFRTDDPILAYRLGAPVGSENPAPAPGMPAPGAPPPPGSPGAPPSPPAPMPDPGPAPAPAPGTGLPPGPPPPQAFMGDPGQFGLAAAPAGPDMRTAMAMAPEGDTGVVTDAAAPLAPYVPPAPATDYSADPNLDFGDGGGPAGAQQTSAPAQEQTTEPHPLFQQIAGMRPQAQRYGATPGGWVDTQRAFKGDPKAVEELTDEYRGLAEQAQTNARTRMQLDEAAMKAEETRLIAQQHREKAQVNELQSTVAQQEEYKRAGYEKIATRNKEIAEMKVNPKELFQDDPGGLFLAALFTGLGQFGASINGGPNTAGDMIQSYIKNNINEQQRQIDEARLENDKAYNALQTLLDEGADPRFAKAQLELMQQTYAATVLKSQQVRQQAQYLGVDTEDVVTAIDEKRINGEAQLMQMLGVEAQQKYRQPTAGGVRQPSQSEISQWLGNVEKAGNITGDLDYKEVQVERAKQEMRGGASPDNVREVGKSLTAGEGVSVADLWTQKEQTEQTLAAIAQQAGGDLPGRGKLADILPDVLVGPEGRQVRRALAQSAEFMLRRLTGAAATDPETARQLKAVAAVYDNAQSSPEEVQRAWRAHSELVDRMVAVRAAGAGPEALEAWKENVRGVMRGANASTDRSILGTGAPQQ